MEDPHKSTETSEQDAKKTEGHPNTTTTSEHNRESQHGIPKKCRAGVVVNEGPDFHIEIREVDVPTPGPDELLIRINMTGLCMTDVHFMVGDNGTPPMSMFNVHSPGHEGAGVVVSLGSNVTTWRVGDRAGVKPIWDVCNSCEMCWEGKENYCRGAVLTGLLKDGTYQEYITSPAKYTSRIPDGVDDCVAGPIMCSASTMYRALIESGLRAGQWVVFPGGGGGVGIQGVQLARIMGFRSIVIDSGEAKRKLSLEMGAETFVDFREVNDVQAEVKRVADGVGAHGVLVTAYQAYPDAIGYIGDRVGGVVVCVALPPKDAVILGADPSIFAIRNLKIMGSLVGTMQDTAKTLEFAQRGLLKQVCDIRSLEQLPDSVQQLRRGEIAGRVVIDFGKP